MDKDFNKIYKEYYPKLKSYFKNKVRDVDLAEDFCQETLLKVWRKLDTYKEDSSKLSTWIYTVASNTLIDSFRVKKPHITYEEEILDNEHTEVTETPETQLISEQSENIISSALLKLDPMYLEVYKCREVYGMSTSLTASKLGLTEGCVKTRLKRAKDFLKDKVN